MPTRYERRYWVVRPCLGTALEDVLNKLEESGYQLHDIYEHGMIGQKSVITQKESVNPVFTVVAWTTSKPKTLPIPAVEKNV